MGDLFDRILSTGVTVGQSLAEQRRVRTINVVAVGAFSCTAVLTVVFGLLGPRILGETPFWLFLSSSVAFMVGYLLVLVVNGSGHHDGAGLLALATGLTNLVFASAFVGFGVGTSVFLAVPAVAALLVTRVSSWGVRWVFVALSVVAFGALAVVDTPVADAISGTWVETTLVVVNFAGMVGFAVAVVWYQRLLADRAENALSKANEQSERLLLNILPSHIAERLKGGESPIADRIDNVSILFADIVDSTPLSEELSAKELVGLLDSLFTRFDELADEFGVEKIKTIGDAYMVVGGLDGSQKNPAAAIADMALAMRSEIKSQGIDGSGELHMRFGIASGPVVAGVIGSRKFSYDLWGETVTVASRMESHGEPDRIQVAEATYKALRESYVFSAPREVQVKGKGPMTVYFLTEPISSAADVSGQSAALDRN
jgi:class 3 adenylate cyclase